jgi:pSer/pThr/pTyr-binding forkhead associated (FHA) protein
MGRAPNPGAPQRVSAHVVPKVPAFPAPATQGLRAPTDALAVPVADEEDEKTTIESGGWEEEASTTVEQGEVADRLRALGLDQPKRPNTGITSTHGDSVSDDPTVDDQRGAAALAMLPPPRIARLVITQGNDLGQAIEVRPGKTYTIGRGIDNDLVLTDMTVSRKHFDLRNDDGAWVLADRGSGNGTLVNQHLEDTPFVLATGDVIEIGNTIFRFEQPNGIPREPPSFGGSDDDLELSTMSGTPVSESEPATPDRLMTPVSRPKTLPPPAPLTRPRPPSNRPGSGYGLERPGQPRPPSVPPIAAVSATALAPPQAMPALQLPPPSLSQQPPATTLAMPQMASRAPMQPATLLEPPLKSLGPTMPGHLPTMQTAHPARLPFAYPSSPGQSGELPRQRQSAILPGVTVVPSASGREAPSTALVAPIAYSSGQPAMVPQQGYPPPLALTRRMKMALAAAAVALFAAVATIAIVRGSSGDAIPTLTGARSGARPGSGAAVEPARAANAKPADPPGSLKPSGPRAPATPTSAATPPAAKPEKITPIVTPIMPPIMPATGSGSATGSGAPGPSGSTSVATPSPQPDRVASVTPDKKTPRRTDRNEKKIDKRPPPKDDRADRIEIESPPPRKHSGRTLQEIKSEAGVLYRRKDFSGAAAIATAGVAAMTGIDAQELKTMAAIYGQLGKTYSVGMAPGTKATDAFVALNRAINFDREVGGAYVAEMQEKLVVIASRAAMLYMAAKDYEAAFQAVKVSDSLGSTSPSNKTVRDKLDAVAGDLYRTAQAELASDRESAKQKLRQILGMVDPRNPLHAKATKLLNGP